MRFLKLFQKLIEFNWKPKIIETETFEEEDDLQI